jgi:hypothetical protein
MNSFSINRFAKTLRWVLSVNYRKVLVWTIGAVLAVFMGELVIMKLADFNNPFSMIMEFAQYGVILLMLDAVILVSTIVSSINEKRHREAFLMLPANNLEKFLALLVYTSVICVLCVFLALVVGDSLRMAWNWISGYKHGGVISFDGIYWWSSAIPMMMNNLLPGVIDGELGTTYPIEYAVVNLIFTIGCVIWIHSLYTLGGTLLRKYAFVATSVFIILCTLLLVRGMMYFNLEMFHISFEHGVCKGYRVGGMGYVLAVLLPLFSAFNYWASFQIFKGFQLLTNKWTNYDILKR